MLSISRRAFRSGGRGGRFGAVGGGTPLSAPQERFMLSGLNPVLPVPTVARTIAETPVLPLVGCCTSLQTRVESQVENQSAWF